jgi:heme/copper-type cytochrome/quinol oxidase subunit 2
MIEFFSHFSTYAVAAMMVSLFVVPSLICLWIVRRFCKPLLFTGHTEFGEIFSSAIGVVFALILAFVAVAVWQNYDKVDDDVFREANSLHNIYRNLEAYPEPLHTHAKNLILQYVQVVFKDELPKLLKPGRMITLTSC